MAAAISATLPSPRRPLALETLRLFALILVGIVTAPYRRTFYLYTWKPLKDFRRVGGDARALIWMVRDWKADKYDELHSVQVAASFCAGAALTTLSWRKIERPSWLADALWLFSLMCSIWAVITSIQTKSILDDIPDKDQLTNALSDAEVQRMKRVILRYRRTPGIGHWAMLFIWQFPSMSMSYAWCSFLAGLTVYVCTPFIWGQHWSNQHKIAIVYLAVFGLGFFTYCWTSVFVYTSEKSFLASTGSEAKNTSALTSESVAGDMEKSAGLARQGSLGKADIAVGDRHHEGTGEEPDEACARRGPRRARTNLLM
ncbi:hypothetical protein M011DRAFT_50239 [Sporormia fimetaria CBS 119925]|uniref:Uncharacterized protein n=1 Tax=Sporormia fimetaria CBS 119925 TaxID=1340428 RepID=A0A6A6VDJ4_9PLEO|nr:hypothetical protein M011DRAFT_50239 [Sporormia fimetaria CBS 119925]